jgi:DNA-directed RNA polymerase alpha subunit
VSNDSRRALYAQDIADLRLGARTENALRQRRNIQTIGDLVLLGFTQAAKTKGVGPQGVVEIRAAMEEAGIVRRRPDRQVVRELRLHLQRAEQAIAEAKALLGRLER